MATQKRAEPKTDTISHKVKTGCLNRRNAKCRLDENPVPSSRNPQVPVGEGRQGEMLIIHLRDLRALEFSVLFHM